MGEKEKQSGLCAAERKGSGEVRNRSIWDLEQPPEVMVMSGLRMPLRVSHVWVHGPTTAGFSIMLMAHVATDKHLMHVMWTLPEAMSMSEGLCCHLRS